MNPLHAPPPWEVSQSQRNRNNVAAGKMGEDVARQLLVMHGVQQVRRIETGWRVMRRLGRIINAVPLAKVSADWRGVMPHRICDGGFFGDRIVGQSVMAEAKQRDKQLRFSDLEKHQHKELTEHQELGGLSFIVWIWPGVGGWLLPYPLVGFAPRHSIDRAMADLRCVRRWTP